MEALGAGCTRLLRAFLTLLPALRAAGLEADSCQPTIDRSVERGARRERTC
jgi:hypothetical protein